MYLIGLDVGTTGCKAIVFDPDGQIKGAGYEEYDVVGTEPAMAEQDAEQVWRLACRALRAAVVRSGVKTIGALSVSVQGDAVIPVDKNLRALHRAVLGMDYRSQPQARECAERCGAFALFRRTGMRPHPMNALTKVMWLRERVPDVFARTWKMVTYADFILGKLGAEPVIDFTMASRTMGFDLAARRWSRTILDKLDLDAALFSRPVPSGTVVGKIRQSLAAELGLPSRVLLASGAHDQSCAALGAGVIAEHRGVVSTGTAEVLATALARPVLTRRMFASYYPCYAHAKPGQFLTFTLNHTAGILLKWFRDQFCQPEIAEARKRRTDPYQVLDGRMPAGPAPVMVLPHFNGSGTPWCDLESKGAFLGLNLATTRHDLAKAILEALTFELRINLDTLEQSGIRVDTLAAAGGGAKSPVWLQMKADILNRPIRTLRCRESACLGAALLAGAAAGVYRSLDEAAAQTVSPDREFTPQAAAVRQYQERFGLYQELYPALRRLGRRL